MKLEPNLKFEKTPNKFNLNQKNDCAPTKERCIEPDYFFMNQN